MSKENETKLIQEIDEQTIESFVQNNMLHRNNSHLTVIATKQFKEIKQKEDAFAATEANTNVARLYSKIISYVLSQTYENEIVLHFNLDCNSNRCENLGNIGTCVAELLNQSDKFLSNNIRIQNTISKDDIEIIIKKIKTYILLKDFDNKRTKVVFISILSENINADSLSIELFRLKQEMKINFVCFAEFVYESSKSREDCFLHFDTLYECADKVILLERNCNKYLKANKIKNRFGFKYITYLQLKKISSYNV